MSKHGKHKDKSIATNNNNNNSNNNNSTKQNFQKNNQATDQNEPNKFDYAVAKYLRSKLPNKEAKFLGIKRVNYFIGSKAVDALLESSKYSAEFKTREAASLYLNTLLVKKLFHRARKIVKMDNGKRKFKLDMHPYQEFEDGSQPFVWLYEPTSIVEWLSSFGVVFGVIAICLFPLWPPIIRTWVYYICITGLILLSSIFGLAIVRHILFAILWCLTLGKVHFWLFPNLTEDVGFLESFWPVYTIEFDLTESDGSGCEDGESDNSSSNNNNNNNASTTASNSDTPASHSHQD